MDAIFVYGLTNVITFSWKFCRSGSGGFLLTQPPSARAPPSELLPGSQTQPCHFITSLSALRAFELGPRDTSLLGSEGVFSVATRRRMANTKRKLRFPMQVLCLLILLYYLWTPFISHDEKGLEDLNQSRVCVLIPISTRSIRAHKTIEHLKWLSPQIGI